MKIESVMKSSQIRRKGRTVAHVVFRKNWLIGGKEDRSSPPNLPQINYRWIKEFNV